MVPCSAVCEVSVCVASKCACRFTCGYFRARSIRPKFPEISVQNSMDLFGPTGKVSKKLVHLLRWTTFRGRNFGRMDRALSHGRGLGLGRPLGFSIALPWGLRIGENGCCPQSPWAPHFHSQLGREPSFSLATTQ